MNKIAIILFLIVTVKFSSAQNNSIQINANNLNNEIAPTDKEPIPYSEKAYINETIAIFTDAIEFSRTDNSYVKPYLNKTGFPKKTGNSSSQVKKFNAELELWIKANPETVKQLYKDRDALHKNLNLQNNID